MSKVNIELDTSKKTTSVSIDGKKVEDVSSVVAYSEISSLGFLVEIVTKEEVGDMKKFTRIVASKDKNTIESKRFPGFFIKSVNKHETNSNI